MCNAFLDLFSNLLLSLNFFPSPDCLLINMQNHGKNYERAESEEAKKKIIFNQTWFIWALCVSWFTCTKSSPFLLLLLKSFKYDKLKPILNLETLIWLRLKERESFWIKKLKTLTPYGLNQELNWYHVMQYRHPQCSFYSFLSAYGLKIWCT